MGNSINTDKYVGIGLRGIIAPSIDASAAAFFAASGITGATQQAAIENLVKGLKSDGLWSKMKAVYPFVTDNRNLAGYTDDFNSTFWIGPLGVTLNSTIAPNGTNTGNGLVEGNKSNTYYISNFGALALSNSSYTLTVYAKKNTRDWVQLSMNNGTTNLFSWFNVNTGTIGTVQGGASASITNVGNGWYRCSMTCTMSTGGNFVRFGPAISDATSTYVGNSSIGIYAWGPQLELGSTATTYQPIATTQQAYIASQFKYNLKDPRDLDAAFRLVFNGGWTHSSTGATPNGTNGWANTYLNPLSVFTANDNVHMGYYSRTNVSSATIDMGSAINASGPYLLLQLNVTGSAYYIMNEIASYTTAIDSDSRGLFIGSRNGTTVKGFKNSSNVATRTGIVAQIRPNKNIYLGAGNLNDVPSNYANRQAAFSTIGDGLTDTEAANLYTRVQAFQTSLSRQV